MRLIFYGQGNHLEQATESLGDNALLTDDANHVLDQLHQKGAALVFIDLDSGKKGEQLLDDIKSSDSKAHVILVSVRLKTLKKHQKKKGTADGYLVGPLTLESISNTLNDIEPTDDPPLHDHPQESGPASVLTSKKIQDHFDDVFPPPVTPHSEEKKNEGEFELLEEDEGHLALDIPDELSVTQEGPTDLAPEDDETPIEEESLELSLEENESEVSSEIQENESQEEPPCDEEENIQEPLDDNTGEIIFSAHQEQETEEHHEAKEALDVFHDTEVTQPQAIIKELKVEREGLIHRIEKMEMQERTWHEQRYRLEEELKEEKIKNQVLREKHLEEMEESKQQIIILEEKKMILEKRSQDLKEELDGLGQEIRIDFNRVKQKEKELENQLEFTMMDAQAQIQGREKKIIELKKKIDQLEFNMENMAIKEKRFTGDKYRLEEGLVRTLKTLQNSVQMLEDSLNPGEMDIKKIDRPLDK